MWAENPSEVVARVVFSLYTRTWCSVSSAPCGFLFLALSGPSVVWPPAAVKSGVFLETTTLPVSLSPPPGFFEEVLFRGVIQQWLSTVLGGIPALGIASVLFGLAHSPVPGASSFTEACYGANFGLLYMVRHRC